MKYTETTHQGRFPSHLLLSHSLFCQPKSCDESCPVLELDRQSGVRHAPHSNGHKGRHNPNVYGDYNPVLQKPSYNDTGTAARYFQQFPPDSPDFVPFTYQAKASRRERNAGCEGLPEQRSVDDDWVSENRKNAPSGGRTSPQSNHHPTVKSIALMRWLIRLVTPPGGTVLDCFAGSGSTCVAAIHEGVHFIGIEQSSEYVAICEARIAHAYQSQPQHAPQEYDCAPECPIRILGEQSGERGNSYRPNTGHGAGLPLNGEVKILNSKNRNSNSGHNDTGTAARYFTQLAPDLWEGEQW